MRVDHYTIRTICFTFCLFFIFFQAGQADKGSNVQASGIKADVLRPYYLAVRTTEPDNRLRESTDRSTEPSERSSDESRGSGESDTGPSNDKSSAIEVFFTSYNPLPEQTDSSPCIGAIGEDVCELSKSGVRTIALSQDLIWGTRGYYCKENCFASYGDKIQIVSDEPQCNFTGILLDTMNSRYTMRGDIFHMTRDMNTSCNAKIINLTR